VMMGYLQMAELRSNHNAIHGSNANLYLP